MIIRGLLSACPVEPGMLARLQGRMRERHRQELVTGKGGEGCRAGGRDPKVREELG